MKTKDPVNQPGLDVSLGIGETRLGLLKNWEWYDDPRRLVFSMARYKFVAKMFAGRKSVLEFGCGDAFCAGFIAALARAESIARTVRGGISARIR